MSQLGNHLMVWPGHLRGLAWGFTYERWQGSLLVLEPENKRVVAWVLHASQERKGYFRELLEAIEADGLSMGVVCPNDDMMKVLHRFNFQTRMETGADGSPLEIWLRTPTDVFCSNTGKNVPSAEPSTE